MSILLYCYEKLIKCISQVKHMMIVEEEEEEEEDVR
jgi:hypothetical protein